MNIGDQLSLARGAIEALQSIALAIASSGDRRGIPQSRWITLKTGMIRIADISTAVQIRKPEGNRRGQPEILIPRGVEFRLRCGSTIVAPDAKYEEVQMAIYAWELTQ